MKWLKDFWCDLVDYVKWQLKGGRDCSIIKEFEEVCDMATKYELLQKHYPNILARLNAAVERKERK